MKFLKNNSLHSIHNGFTKAEQFLVHHRTAVNTTYILILALVILVLIFFISAAFLKINYFPDRDKLGYLDKIPYSLVPFNPLKLISESIEPPVFNEIVGFVPPGPQTLVIQPFAVYYRYGVEFEEIVPPSTFNPISYIRWGNWKAIDYTTAAGIRRISVQTKIPVNIYFEEELKDKVFKIKIYRSIGYDLSQPNPTASNPPTDTLPDQCFPNSTIEDATLIVETETDQFSAAVPIILFNDDILGEAPAPNPTQFF